MIQVKRIPCGNVNCFLLTGPEGAVLVDAGRAGYGEKILAACQGCGVRLLLLTHGHLDHIQNAAFLMEHLGVPAALHRGDLALLESNLCRPIFAHTWLGRAMRALSLHSFQTQMLPSFLPAVFLEEGDSLAPWGVDAKVVALPGHTAGSIGVDVEDRELVVGDAMMNLFSPSPALIYEDRAAMSSSVEKILRLGPRMLHFGHGKSRPL